MTDINRTLKAAIEYERSKTDVTNLVNHKLDDLSIMIDTITLQMKESESVIAATEKVIADAEDMSEVVETVLRRSISDHRQRVENLYAWRLIFLSAWSKVNRKITLNQ